LLVFGQAVGEMIELAPNPSAAVLNGCGIAG
jgi:hypothetical protein